MGHDVPSLKIGAKNLGQVTELSVPAITQPLLSIRIADNEHEKSNSNGLWQCGAPIPTAFGPLLRTRVVRNECVTRTDTGRIGKAKWELELALITTDQDGTDDQQQQRVLLENCDAGDSFNVLFENPEQEVDFVLNRLGFCAETADTEHTLELHKVPENNGKFAHFPSHCSPRQLIAQFIDIRRAPSRLVLRVFADHAHEPAERRRLLELCSAQGATEFTKFVRQPNISLVELLCTFPSLTPPLESLIECLPRLLPRHYTLCCYLTAQPHNQQQLRFRFVYSVLEMPPSVIIDECAEFEGQKQQQKQIRYGACTQWLLQQRPGQTVQIIQKEPSKFRFLPPSFVPSPASMPSSGSTMIDQSDYALLLLNMPLMMVGPGTGVAPFIAFLQKIRHFMQRMGGDGAHCGRVKRVLFYASSNLDDEFLFRSELQQMVADGVLSDLVLCESRPTVADSVATATAGPPPAGTTGGDNETPPQPHHQQKCHRPQRVYDALRQRSAEVAHFLMPTDNEAEEGGLFYACGDVKNMSRELWACLSDILQREKGFSPVEAIQLLKKLREKERLIEDVWS